MEWRRDHAGRNGVHPDLLRDQLLRIAARERRNKAFCGGVKNGPSAAAVAGCDRRRVDDEAALTLEPGNGGSGHRDNRTRVEIDHRAHALVVRLERGNSAEHQTGIVDKPVETAKTSRRLGDDPVAFARICDVALDCKRFAAAGLDLTLDRERGRLARMIADRDPGALLGEAQRHRRPDASRAAGDENRLAGEIGNDDSG